MTLEYSGTNINKKPGSYSVAVKYKGEIEGIETSITFKGSHESVIEDFLTKGLREIDLSIFDPNRKIEEFVHKDPILTDELSFGIPIDRDVIRKPCADCGLEIWAYPEETEPPCPKCQNDRKNENFRKGQKQMIKENRTRRKENSEFEIPDFPRLENETEAEYKKRKQAAV